MTYTVLADFHHASLLQSLILLFEKRLGGTVYRPIGLEWAQGGFWRVYDHPATQAQYLGIGSATPDGTPPLNDLPEGINRTIFDIAGFYLCRDIDSGQFNKACTLEAFLHTPFDIIIASMPVHIEPFKALAKMHYNKPKLIYQIGNAWTVEAGMANNIMASALVHNVPPSVNFISYHQEFDLNIFKHMPGVEPGNNIYSFVNVFNGEAHLLGDWELFKSIEQQMPEYIFKSYGGQCRDGAVGPAPVLADKMREARFIWHTKAGGDGYGHIIHNAGAVGRPLIVKKQYYIGKMAEVLLEDGVTCIAIDGLGQSEILNKILHYSDPGRYAILSTAFYDRFKLYVDFDKEELQLRKFLESLQ